MPLPPSLAARQINLTNLFDIRCRTCGCTFGSRLAGEELSIVNERVRTDHAANCQARASVTRCQELALNPYFSAPFVS